MYLIHRLQHSLPTRRSSDLVQMNGAKGFFTTELVEGLDFVSYCALPEAAPPSIACAEDKLRRTHQQLASALHTLQDRKSTRLNSSHSQISYAVYCMKKKDKS